MHDPAVAHVEAGGQMRVAIEGRQALIGELDDERQRRVVQRLRRSHRNAPGMLATQ